MRIPLSHLSINRVFLVVSSLSTINNICKGDESTWLHFHRETVVKHESGIEGMLSRLEKERSATFGARKNDLHPETTGNEVMLLQ